MTDRVQFNTRLSQLTHNQIAELAKHYGLNKTEVVTIAIDRLFTELKPRNKPIIKKPR